METSGVIDKDCPFGALFQQIINEMKNCAPLWEELTGKSTKLHSCLRATIQAVSAFLDTLQKIADAATSTRGATKDIGTALTRICLRHKAVEAKMKTFTSSLMDCLILPLQDKLEDWKKSTVQLDKDHAKEYKRARSELKKKSIETVRLQKKLRKGSVHNGGMGGSFTGGTLPRNHGSGTSLGNNGSDSISLHGHGGSRDLNRILEVALRDSADKRQAFEDTEKQAIRNALLEERSRFALFVSYLKPVVDEEIGMFYELSHVQEAMQQLEKHSADPYSLPPASEQVIADLKGSCGAWSFQTPPSSPSSLGSRKSSMCSISSVNSSSSGSNHSPSHKAHRTIHHPPVMPGQGGTLRYSSNSSQDSGFTDTPYTRYTSFCPQYKAGNQSEGSNGSSTASSNSSTPSPHGNTTLTTWPNLEDSMQFERAACAIMNERPHTISSAYERGHQRPPLTVYTFQPPNPNDPGNHQESPSTPVVTPVVVDPQSHHSLGGGMYQSATEIYGILRKADTKPPVPKRGSSLERPQSAASGTPKPLSKSSKSKDAKKHHQKQQAESSSINNIYASNVPDFNQSAEDMIVPQPMYVNLKDLSQMAKEKKQRQGEDLPPPPPELMGSANKVDGGDTMNGAGDGSLGSSGYGSQGQIGIPIEDHNPSTGMYGYTTGGREVLIRDAQFCYCLESSSGYCTLPRRIEHFDNCPFSRRGRPLVRHGTLRGCPPGRQPSSGTGSRRNSCSSQEKPPPPVRRNSTITASPSRNSPVPMMPHNQSNSSTNNAMNNYQSSPMKQTSPPQINPNAPTGYPIYIQNPTYSHNGNSSGSANNSYSLSSSQGSSMDSDTPHASMERLPPPPAYLMGQNGEKKNSASPMSVEDSKRTTSVAEAIKSLTEKNHHPVSPHMVRRAQSLRQEEPPSPAQREKEIRSTPSSRRGSSHNTESNGSNNKSRSNLIQVLNQKLVQHQIYGSTPPNGGPSNVPHNYQHQSHPIYQQLTPHQQQQLQHQYSQSQPIYSQVYQQSMSPQPIYQQIPDLNNIMGNSNGNAAASPRTPRRISEELLKTTATFVQSRVLGSKTPPPIVTSKEIFVQTLNAKLSQMRHSPPTDQKNSCPFPQNPHVQHPHQPPPNPKPTSFASKLVASVSSNQKGNSVGEISRAFRVRQWISSKTVPDPTTCRESLMDQIRRGTKLKPTRTVNDRSAPKIYH